MKTQNFNVPVTIHTRPTEAAEGRVIWTYRLTIFGIEFGTSIEPYETEASAIRAAERHIRESSSSMKLMLTG